MSTKLEAYLESTGGGIPWEEAASFFVALKDASLEKRAQAERPAALPPPACQEVPSLAAQASKVRELWKQAAQGGVTSPSEQAAYTVGSDPAGTEPAAYATQASAARKGEAAPQPRIVNSDGPSPEQLEQARAQQELEAMLMEDAAAQQAQTADALARAEQAERQAQELEGLLQQSQVQTQQVAQQAQAAAQQAQVVQQQAAMQQQAQQSQNQMLLDQSLASKQQLMQLRQAIQNAGEQLQSIAMGAQQASAPPEMLQETPPAAAQQPPEAIAAGGAPPQPGAPQPPAAPQMSPQAPPQEAGAVKTASFANKLTGAAVGAAITAGMQYSTDRTRDPNKPSAKENMFRRQVMALENKPDKDTYDKHRLAMTRALYDISKNNRENPGAAALMAAVPGAVLGYSLGPSIGRAIKSRMQARQMNKVVNEVTKAIRK